jgi:hypothetical protein
MNLTRIEALYREANVINDVFKDFFNKHELYIDLISLTHIQFRGKDYTMNFSYDIKYFSQLDGVSLIFSDSEGNVGCSIQNLIEFTTGLDGDELLNRIGEEEKAGGLKIYNIALLKYLSTFFADYNGDVLKKMRVFLKSKYDFL